MAWDRPDYVPGGGEAVLHYVVPGAKAAELAISRARHRVEAVPKGLGVFASTPEQARLAAIHADPALAAALDEALGPRAGAVRAADRAAVLHGSFPDPRDLGYLRSTLGVVAALLDAGGLAVLDGLARRWWSPEDFREKVHARDELDPFQQVTLISAEMPDGTWLYTRGFRKFGRPDLSVPGVAASWYQAALELVGRLAWAQVRGHVVRDGERIRIAGVAGERVCRVGGGPDDPTFGNFVVQIAPAEEPAGG